MKTGKLTPKTNDTMDSMRFTGGFGQPSGFGSVLTATVKEDGGLCLTLNYKMDMSDGEHMWSVELNNEQRNALGSMISKYQPVLYERIGKNND